MFYIYPGIYSNKEKKMGFFSKKEKKSEPTPILPPLPKLPDLPPTGNYPERDIHQLPSFPTNSLGSKFSRDSIKDAVSGGKREEEDMYPEEDSDDELRMIQEQSLKRPGIEEVGAEPLRKRQMGSEFHAEAEPVFIRIDNFEEGLKLFETVKGQISEIESTLADTRRIKDKEDAELQEWEGELKKIRDELEKIGGNIFSKV